MISFHGGDQGKSYSGIAAGGFDQGGTGPENAFLLGFFYHRQRDAVFDAAAGVEIFHFGDDGGGYASFRREFVQGKQGGVTD